MSQTKAQLLDPVGVVTTQGVVVTGVATATSFTGCVRGFCGITSYRAEANPEQLVFSTSSAASHEGNLYDATNGKRTREGVKIENLTILFLKEFLKKTKKQLLPGLEIAIKSMKKNEQSEFLISSTYGFGEFGCPPR